MNAFGIEEKPETTNAFGIQEQPEKLNAFGIEESGSKLNAFGINENIKEPSFFDKIKSSIPAGVPFIGNTEGVIEKQVNSPLEGNWQNIDIKQDELQKRIAKNRNQESQDTASNITDLPHWYSPDPTLLLTGGALGIKTGVKAGLKGLPLLGAAAKEAVGWFTMGASDLPEIATSVGKKFLFKPNNIAEKLSENKINDIEKGLENLATQENIKSQSGALTLKKEIFKPSIPMDNIESEALYQSAKGIKKVNIIQKIKTVAIEVGNKFTRDFENLSGKDPKNAQLIFDLKFLEKQKDVVADRATRNIAETLSELDKNGYDIFNRKIIFNDLLSDVNKGLYENKELPFKLTKESLNKEINKIDNAIKDNPILQNALTKRQLMWDKVQSEYIDALKPYKLGVEDMFKDNYYRHQVLDYVDNNGIFGTGKRLKPPTNKGYTKERTGYSGLYNTDYLESEHQIMSQMLHDAETAKTLTKIKNKEDIFKSIKTRAKEKGIDDWKKLIPDGYTVWQPREGNVFYPAMTISEETAKKILTGELDNIAGIGKELKEVLAIGGRRPEWVVRQEVADTLDNLTRERTKGIISSVDFGVMNAWKKWQLVSPRRFFKYNIRNLSGDAESSFLGNSKGFSKVPRAVKELGEVFFNKKPIPEDMKAWFNRGGMSSTLQAQEMDGLKEMWMYSRLYEKKGGLPNVWNQYWKKARLATDYREAILRYSNFLDYKEQLIKGNGIPKNYGASKPEMIDALKDINDKAFWLSNDLLGAYDRVSVGGHFLRERIYPFWSWQEVNAKRYLQLYKNAANDGNLTMTIGKKLGATTPRVALKIGSLAIKTAALTSALAVYNNTIFPEEEKRLPRDIKNTPHIILGKDDQGNIQYFNRLGTLNDFISWFGLDSAPKFINDYLSGKQTTKELLKSQIEETTKAPINKITQGAFPITKVAYETITRRSTFPNIFKPGTIRDRFLNVARSFGLENEYTALAGLPSKGYSDSIKNFVIYKIDPGEAAYRNIYDLRNDFLKKLGKEAEGFWLTPSGDAYYNMKLAIKYKDKKSFSKYFTIFTDVMKEQMKLGNMGSSIMNIITSMHPLSGLTPVEQAKFIKSLNDDDKEILKEAMNFYKNNLTNLSNMYLKIKNSKEK